LLGEVRERLTPRAVPLQLPIGREDEFTGIVDLIGQQTLKVVAYLPAPVDMPPVLGTVPHAKGAKGAGEIIERPAALRETRVPRPCRPIACLCYPRRAQ